MSCPHDPWWAIRLLLRHLQASWGLARGPNLGCADSQSGVQHVHESAVLYVLHHHHQFLGLRQRPSVLSVVALECLLWRTNHLLAMKNVADLVRGLRRPTFGKACKDRQALTLEKWIHPDLLIVCRSMNSCTLITLVVFWGVMLRINRWKLQVIELHTSITDLLPFAQRWGFVTSQPFCVLDTEHSPGWNPCLSILSLIFFCHVRITYSRSI